MASDLYLAGLDVAPAVGAATATEFRAFTQFYTQLPEYERILIGDGDHIAFPEEPPVRYALVVRLTARADDATKAYRAFEWLTQAATPEWVQLCAVDLFRLMRQRGQEQHVFVGCRSGCPAVHHHFERDAIHGLQSCRNGQAGPAPTLPQQAQFAPPPLDIRLDRRARAITINMTPKSCIK